MTEPFKARQSTLRALSVCPRRTYHDLLAGEDAIRGHTEATAELGTTMHAIAAAILRTLYENGETEMNTYDAEAIAWEVYDELPYVLPAKDVDDLIGMVYRFVERPKRVDLLLPTEDGPAIEQRIDVPIRCQDGQTRILSCQPDAVFATDARGVAVIPDWKSSRMKPPKPRVPQEGVPDDTAVGFDYLSPQGHFQAPCYALAALHRWPAIKRVVFREFYLRYGLYREFELERNSGKAERFERMIGIHLAKLERGLSEGEGAAVWYPRPSSVCTKQCPVARSCPVPEEQRGVGAIEDDESAEREAARYINVNGLRNTLRDALKARYNATGVPIRVGTTNDALSWGGGAGGAYEVVHVPSGVNGNGAEQVNEQPKETAA